MNTIFGLLGLAKRAGKVICGESACKEAIRFRKAFLVLIASDAGANTLKSITNSCKYYSVQYLMTDTMESLGHAVGNRYNAVVAVSDEGFAKGILKQIQANINEGE